MKEFHEEDLELEELDLGKMQRKEIKWVWRTKTFRVNDLVDAVSISPDLTLIQYYDYASDSIKKALVKQHYKKVIQKWEDAEKIAMQFSLPSEEDLKEEENTGEDEDDD